MLQLQWAYLKIEGDNAKDINRHASKKDYTKTKQSRHNSLRMRIAVKNKCMTFILIDSCFYVFGAVGFLCLEERSICIQKMYTALSAMLHWIKFQLLYRD